MFQSPVNPTGINKNHWPEWTGIGDRIGRNTQPEGVPQGADNFVMGFQYRSDANNLRANLERRLATYGLTLHPEKTRLLEFGRFAQANRQEKGLGKVESFAFLGFTHRYSTRKRDGSAELQRWTVTKRLRVFLQEVKMTLRERRHAATREQGVWLVQVGRGYFQYHAIPGILAALERSKRCGWRRLGVVANVMHFHGAGLIAGYGMKAHIGVDSESGLTQLRSQKLKNKQNQLLKAN
jgi:hypothetical protein